MPRYGRADDPCADSPRPRLYAVSIAESFHLRVVACHGVLVRGSYSLDSRTAYLPDLASMTIPKVAQHTAFFCMAYADTNLLAFSRFSSHETR